MTPSKTPPGKAVSEPKEPARRRRRQPAAPSSSPDTAVGAGAVDIEETPGSSRATAKPASPAPAPLTPYWKEIGKAIRRLRRGMDQSQWQLAEAAGVSRNWISNIERGWACSQSVLALILEHLQLPNAQRFARVLVQQGGTPSADLFLQALQSRATKALQELEARLLPHFYEIPATDPYERSRYTEDLPGGLLRMGDQVYDEDGALLIGKELPPLRPDAEIRTGVAFRLRLISAELRVIVAALQEFPPPVSIAAQIVNGLKALILDSDDLAAELAVASEYSDDLRERGRRINELADAFRQMMIELTDAADRAYVVQTMIGEPSRPPSDGAKEAFLCRLAYERQRIIGRYTREELDLMWYHTPPGYVSGYLPKNLRFARRDHGDNQTE